MYLHIQWLEYGTGLIVAKFSHTQEKNNNKVYPEAKYFN